MSLNLALSTAVSSLLTLQQQMAVASNNLANANTTGYSKQTVDVASVVVSGIGAGVTSAGVSINVDPFLFAAVLKANTSASGSDTYAKYYYELQQALGAVSTSTTGGDDIASRLSSLESALSALANNPEQSSLETKVVVALDNLTSALRSTSASIQSLRNRASDGIAETVADINTQVSTVQTLNSKIATAIARGENTAALEDQRNAALLALSGDLGISYYTDSNNMVQVFTKAGQSLLVGNIAREVSYAAPAYLSPDSTYAGGTIPGIMLSNNDITSQLQASGGKIAALIGLRDVDLPAAQDELDNLANGLVTRINQVYNQGTPYPATTTITGSNSTAFNGTDALSTTATVRIAQVDQSGKIQGYQDINLSSATNINDMITLLNGSGLVNASLNASGQLVLTSSNPSLGISTATVSGDVGGTNFSAYFHMNDLLVSENGAQSISVMPSILAKPSLWSSASLSTATGTAPLVGLTSGDASIAQSLVDALLTRQDFPAAGSLSSTSATLAGYATTIVTNIATRASNAEADRTTQDTVRSTLTGSLSSQSGVNSDEETAHLLVLQNAFASSSKVISTVQTMFKALLDAVA
ncbi:MAG: flagellar hook-associated protein FlgK [Rhodospirillaceae bacterium]|nr:flagellar hook-associated protein FlgK [Rhodospirillaceae bacterium]